MVQQDEMTGAVAIARTLHAVGVDTVFTVSGNQILPLLDALPDAGIRIVHMRHETAAAYAAAGFAEVRGTPGVVLTSAGPAFLAALHGVAIANSMELPILFLSGASPLSQRGGGAFQDVAQCAIASAVCKTSSEIANADVAAQTVADAYAQLQDGIPGVVHLAMPVDVLTTRTRAVLPEVTPTLEAALRADDLAALQQIAHTLMNAQRPAIIVRPTAARGPIAATMRLLAARLGIAPIVAESPRGMSDSKYAEMAAHLAQSDALLVIAPADFTLSFLTSSGMPSPEHIMLIDASGDPSAAITPAVHAQIPPGVAIAWLMEHVSASVADPTWCAGMNVAPPSFVEEDDTAGIHPQAGAQVIRSHVEASDILVLDGGEFCQWARLAMRDLSNRVLWNGKFGAIGGSLPMALGAKVADPAREVIAMLGDGSAGYFLSELETAFREDIKIIAVIGNDERWGAEWHMQVERYGPERTFSTSLTPARYDVAAAGYGAAGYDLDYLSDLDAAMLRARRVDLPVCINLHVLPERSPAIITH